MTKLLDKSLFPEDWKPNLELQTNLLDHNINVNIGRDIGREFAEMTGIEISSISNVENESLFPEDWKPNLELQTNLLDHNINVNIGRDIGRDIERDIGREFAEMTGIEISSISNVENEPLFPKDWKPNLELPTNILDHNINVNIGREFAEMTGIEISSISNVENDQSYVATSINTLDSLAINPEHLINFITND